ncbi:MAG: hypothetical protein PWQ12_1551 [Clostridiales bacterium]|jgi:phosphoglycerol transferase MdoB-like AlkP superfamily enzyme|nr:hypothetical protein [Clostridiales bacterium]
MLKENLNRMWTRLSRDWKLDRIYWLKLSVFLVFILMMDEWLYRRDVVSALMWPVHYPVFFLMNFFVLLGVSAVLVIMTGRLYGSSMAVGVPVLLIGAVNAAKMALRNVPLTVEDFSLLKEVLALSDALFNQKTILYVVMGIAAIFVMSRLIKSWYGSGRHTLQRPVAVVLVAISVAVFAWGQVAFSSDLPLIETGFIYSLSNPLRQEKGFSAEARAEAEAALENSAAVENPVDALSNTGLEEGEQPNIIIIQSEAFWDVTKLGIAFTQDPISNFEALQEESLHGRMYVPVVGGGTSNTEFEVLTGLTMKNYYNDWYMVYPNEISAPEATLASILRTQGYTSIGTHPYMSWYYNRREVYKYFGFDRFETLEYLDNPELIGTYTSDAYLMDRIMDTIESEDKPIFDFVVTMQNHGPYGNPRFDTFDVKIADRAGLSDPAVYFLNNYVQGVYLSDQALGTLIDKLRESDEPTLVMFYGDHLPMLGEDYLTYREAGYVGTEDSNTLQQDLSMMTVPYIIWSNYGAPTGELPVMNASFMTPRLLEIAGAEVPDYLKAIKALSENTPIITRSYVLASDGTRAEEGSDAYQVARAQYQLIWDRMRASEDPFDMTKWIISDNSDYNATLNDIRIETVSADGGKTVIGGTHLYSNAVLLVNGSEQGFDWTDETQISINKKLKSGDVLMMRLSDSEGTVLAESAAYTMP